MVLGQSRSVSVAKPFGILTDSVPIIVPPGRRDVEPHISLDYSSGGENGILGLGWDLNLGYIELNRRNGLPASGNPDTFSFSIAGLAGELNNDGTGVYHSRTELVYREFRKTSAGGWEMRDGQGNRYLFGSTINSRINSAVWYLDTITDPSGNQILYNYMQNLSAFYPASITYTGYNGNPGPNAVNFTYEMRPDVRNTFQHGVSETRQLRLKTIDADFGTLNFLARRYQLTYGLTSSGQSVITRIDLFGADGVSTFPLRVMSYSTFAKGWSQTPMGTVPADFIDAGNGADLGQRLVDINGDGCMDSMLDDGSIFLGNCEGSFTFSPQWSGAVQGALNSLTNIVTVTVDSNGDVTTQDQGVRYLDVNGDGRPDVVIANSTLNRLEVWLNTYDGLNASTIGFAKATTWSFPQGETSYDPSSGTANCPNARTDLFSFSFVYGATDNNGNSVPGAPTGVSLVDVNGDGLPDLVWSLQQDTGNGSYCINAVYLNTGGGWLRNEQMSIALRGLPFQYTNTVPFGIDFVDINSDGKADIVFTPATGASSVWLNTGSNWVQDVNFTNTLRASGLISVDSNGVPTGLQWVDYNHDGLLDAVLVNSAFPTKVFQNTGIAFVEDPGMETAWNALPDFVGTSGTNAHAQTASLADVNGDGVLDLIDYKTGNVYLGGVCPSPIFGCVITATERVLPEGLMLQSSGPLGEKATITWDRAPAGLPLPQFVPISVQRSESRSDSKIGVLSYQYSYSSPTYNDRMFMGFSSVQEEQPNGNTVTTTYNTQNDLFTGQEVTVSIVDPNFFHRYSKVNTYTSVTNAGNPTIQQGMLATTDETFYDPTANYTSHTGYLVYDNRLNQMAVYRNPNTSVTGLDYTTTSAYVRNDNAAIWNLPAFVNVFQGTTQTAISRTSFYYDNLAQYNVLRGLVTSEQEEIVDLPTQEFVTRTMTYDQYGNVLTNTDPDGNTSSFVYDAVTSTFRISAKDPDGNEVQSTFDPKWGSVLTDTDASGNTTTFQYDVFGRLQEVIKPGDSALPGGTTHYLYSLLPVGGTGFNVTRFDSTTDCQLPMESIDYYDAFGQIYMNQRAAPGSKNIVTTTDRDDMSLPVRFSRPYYSGAAANYTTLTRDPMHRIITIVDADGQTTTRSYAALQVTETDPRGLKTVTVMNPNQQVTKKILPTTSGTATTQFVYDASNELVQMVKANGSITTMTYDLLGRKTSISDPNTGTFQYAYDNASHITAITDPVEKKILYAYDKDGNLISRTYSNGTKQTVTYGGPTAVNAVGRVISVTDAAGTLQLAYDTKGRITKRTRKVLANGKTYNIKYTYDAAGHLLTLTYPDGYMATYAYDRAGNVASVTDNRGQTVANSFSYSASGRLLGLTYGNGTHSSYTYDVLDRMTNLQTERAANTAIQNLTYAYDADSNVASIEDAVNGYNQQFAYDPMNRLISAVGGYGTENYTYDAVGNLLTKGTESFLISPVHPEQATCMMINATNLYSDAATACNQGAFGTRVINYDTRGNVVKMGALQYTYDSENRLMTESNGTSLLQTNVYDFWGDRVVQKTAAETRIFIENLYEVGANGVSDHVRTPNLLLMTLVTPPAAAVAGSTPKVTNPGLIATIRRYRPKPISAMQLLESLLGITLLLLVFGSAIRVKGNGRGIRVSVGMPQVWRLQPGTGFVNISLIFALLCLGCTDAFATPPLPQDDVSSGSSAVFQTPATATTQQRYYYHLNHLGGVNMVTDSTGTVVEQQEYKPYGETYVSAGTATMPFAYDGERPDGTNATTGLYYVNARYYCPQIGRFLSADSVIDRPSTPQALHRYAFAGGNPIRYVDPSGHSWWDFVIGAAIFTAIIVFAAIGGGPELALVASSMGVLGFGIGAVVATALGYSASSESFWNVALTGAIIGAAFGAAFGNLFLATPEEAATAGGDVAADNAVDAAEAPSAPDPPDPPKPSNAFRAPITNALRSMAFGGPQSVMIHELQGGSTDSLLLAVSESEAEAAATGVVGGMASGAVGDALSGTLSASTITGGKLALAVVSQAALWTFAGVEKQSLGSYIYAQVKPSSSSSNAPAPMSGYNNATSYYSSGNNSMSNSTPY
ncbi:MAG: FG-GAP-like repeat-containing protein [Acidobacteriaceae bacterium]